MRLDFQTGRVGRSTESGLKPSKRRHYRVTGNDLNGISVSLKIAGQSKPVQLIDISSAGAALAFIGAEKAQVASLFGTTLRPPEVEILANQLGETIASPAVSLTSSRSPPASSAVSPSSARSMTPSTSTKHCFGSSTDEVPSAWSPTLRPQ